MARKVCLAKYQQKKLGNDICLGDFEPHTVSVMGIVQTRQVSFWTRGLIKEEFVPFSCPNCLENLGNCRKRKKGAEVNVMASIVSLGSCSRTVS